VVGRIQPRYMYVPSDDGVEGTNSLTARRMRLGAAGDLSKNVGFTIVGEYANTDNRTQLLDALLTFRSLEDTIGHVLIGRAFIPAYINSAARTIAVERNFVQYLGPGQSGRAWGVGLSRGALYGRMGQGFFGDRLHYWAGIHNGSSGNTQDDNNELLYSLRVDLMPNGPMQGDEWNLGRTPFRWGVGVSGSYGNESSGQPDLDFNNALNGAFGLADVSRLENRWMGAHAQFEGHGWFGLAQYARLESEDADGSTLLIDAQGGADSELKSDAWLFGLSRVMGQGFSPGHQWGLGFQYQLIDNAHAFRTRFMGPRRNNLTTGTSALNFNEGSSYNLVLMYAAARNLRFHAEYDINDEKDSGVPDNNALTLQGVLDF
ncbi:hypothetical protein, partial [Candidatus Methylomirabilis sp.]|uniref:hypothetical protein n=1 Tax=Candidatus Methylomirabilis sp. TaxID=2032687 RepID=UPI003C766DA6